MGPTPPSIRPVTALEHGPALPISSGVIAVPLGGAVSTLQTARACRETVEVRWSDLREAGVVAALIRRVASTELTGLHAIRLEALLESPEAFGSTYQSEVDADPSSRLPWVTKGVAVIAEDATGWCGLATGAMDGTVVYVYAMWVHPDRRGEGIGQALLDGVLAWGRDRGGTVGRLGVVDDNVAAASLYRRDGFSPSGERETLQSDESHEVVYLMKALG